ncbi:hypothetical protein R0J90_16260, partial [Micrococcus sp. SIMBA_144]
IDTTLLLNTAVKKGAAYVPGAPFFVADAKSNTMRLNFTHSTQDKIEKGMEILVDVFQEAAELDLEKTHQ